jgi:hypothetical protein
MITTELSITGDLADKLITAKGGTPFVNHGFKEIIQERLESVRAERKTINKLIGYRTAIQAQASNGALERLDGPSNGMIHIKYHLSNDTDLSNPQTANPNVCSNQLSVSNPEIIGSASLCSPLPKQTEPVTQNVDPATTKDKNNASGERDQARYAFSQKNGSDSEISDVKDHEVVSKIHRQHSAVAKVIDQDNIDHLFIPKQHGDQSRAGIRPNVGDNTFFKTDMIKSTAAHEQQQTSRQNLVVNGNRSVSEHLNNKALTTKELDQTPLKRIGFSDSTSNNGIEVAALSASSAVRATGSIFLTSISEATKMVRAADSQDGFTNNSDHTTQDRPGIQVLTGAPLIKATASTVEVGAASPSLGWMKIRAEIDVDGKVNASISPSSLADEHMLHAELPKLSSFLQTENVTIGSVNVHPTHISPGDSQDSGRGAASDMYSNQQQESKKPPTADIEQHVSKDEEMIDQGRTHVAGIDLEGQNALARLSIVV